MYSTKCLGVYINHKLTWKEHISSVCQKVGKCTAIINRIKHIVNKDYLSFLYASLIEPHLTYCVELWGNAYKSSLHPCTSGRCSRQSEFTVAFYDILLILRSAAALFRQ